MRNVTGLGKGWRSSQKAFLRIQAKNESSPSSKTGNFTTQRKQLNRPRIFCLSNCQTRGIEKLKNNSYNLWGPCHVPSTILISVKYYSAPMRYSYIHMRCCSIFMRCINISMRCCYIHMRYCSIFMQYYYISMRCCYLHMRYYCIYMRHVSILHTSSNTMEWYSSRLTKKPNLQEAK